MAGYTPAPYPMSYSQSQYGYPHHPADPTRYNKSSFNNAGMHSRPMDSQVKAAVREAPGETGGSAKEKEAEVRAPSNGDSSAHHEPASAAVSETSAPAAISSVAETPQSIAAVETPEETPVEEKTVVLPDDEVDNTISFLAEDTPTLSTPAGDTEIHSTVEEAVASSGETFTGSEPVIDEVAIDFMGVETEGEVDRSSSESGANEQSVVEPPEYIGNPGGKRTEERKDKDTEEPSRAGRKVSFDRRGAVLNEDKGGWRKEKLTPVVKKYTKEEIVALYERGAQPPTEIMSSYPDAKDKGPVVASSRGIARQNSSGSRRALGGSRSSTPNLSPEDLAIFNPNKENVFKYSIDFPLFNLTHHQTSAYIIEGHLRP